MLDNLESFQVRAFTVFDNYNQSIKDRCYSIYKKFVNHNIHFFKENGIAVVLLSKCVVYLSMIVITEVEIKDHLFSD